MNCQFLMYLCLIFNTAVLAKNVRIINGVDADIRDVPYIASLRLYSEKQYFCAGAIITSKHILTAAHCVDDLDLMEFRIYVGSTSSINYSIPFYKVQNVKIHPRFLKTSEENVQTRYDIAVVTISPSITFNEFQKKIKLPTTDPPFGELGLISGWGWKSYPVGSTSDNLQKLSVWIITNEDCADNYLDLIHEQQVCVFRNFDSGACVGDSGGPLVYNNALIGIASFSNPCAKGDPDVFMNVYYFLEFIESVISCDCLPINCLTL